MIHVAPLKEYAMGSDITKERWKVNKLLSGTQHDVTMKACMTIHKTGKSVYKMFNLWYLHNSKFVSNRKVEVFEF